MAVLQLNLEQVPEIYRQIQEEHICGPSGEQTFVSKCSATARFVWQYRVNAISLYMR